MVRKSYTPEQVIKQIRGEKEVEVSHSVPLSGRVIGCRRTLVRSALFRQPHLIGKLRASLLSWLVEYSGLAIGGVERDARLRRGLT